MAGTPPPPSAPSAWTPQAQLATAFLLGAVTALLSERFWFTTPPPPVWGRAYQLDLNTASRAELEQLPRIGPNLADRIVAARPCNSVDDLNRVPGIGPTTLAQIRSHLKTDGAAESPTPTPIPKLTSPDDAIDINRADAEQLQRLPGIGAKLAARILAAREEQPFRELADLRRVSGIGVKTLEKIRPFVRFESPPD